MSTFEGPRAGSIGPPGYAPPPPALGTRSPGPAPSPRLFAVDPQAALGRRACAWIVDSFVLGVLTGAGGFLASVIAFDRTGAVLETDRFGLGTLAFVSVYFAYFLVLEAYDGQTIGKRAAGVRVVRLADGGVPSTGAIVTRTLLRVVDQWFIVIGLVSMAFTGRARRQRVGDRAAGTTVVRAGALSREHAGLVRTGAAIAVPLLITVAIISPIWPALGVRTDRDAIAATAERFVAAVAANDVAGACAIASRPQQLDEVARARRAASGPASCATRGRFDSADRAAAARLRRGPAVVGIAPDSSAAVVSVAGHIALALVHEDGEWRIDELAVTRYEFVHGCARAGVHVMHCRCVFDQMRARGMRTPSAYSLTARAFASGALPRASREAMVAATAPSRDPPIESRGCPRQRAAICSGALPTSGCRRRR